MENKPEKTSKFPASNWVVILKAFLILIFLPIAAVWYIWEKTTWSKRSKWIATAAIVFVTVILFSIDSSNTENEKNKEAEALKARVAVLENNLAQEKQKNVTENAQNVLPESKSTNNPASSELFDVVGVTDGDTIKVSINGKIEALRLIGIDTPETVDPRKAVQCFGKEASDKAKEILTGKKVMLEADGIQGERDQYGRLLRFIFLKDGTFFNQKMIEEGYAHEYTYQNKPYKYQTQFKDAEKTARENKLGLWAQDSCNGDTEKAAAAISSDSTVSLVTSTTSSVEASGAAVVSPVSIGGVVKKSTTGICHAPGTSYYEKTKTFTSFDSIQQCLDSGGRLPLR
jgi:micrococcal nuclease